MIIEIDGRKCNCEKGEYLLDVAARNGIYIPTLCHNESLRGMAACRICSVEIETEAGGQVVSACVYPVEIEIKVRTDSVKIKGQRRMLLSLLAAKAPESGIIRDRLQAEGGSLPERFIRLEGKKCILCGLCVQACEKVGSGAIGTFGRGTEKKVSTPYGDPSADCIGCSSCAAVCPTGAIAVSEEKDARTIWGKTFALVKCEKCGAAVGTREELKRAAKIAGTEPPALCAECRKKAVADVLAETYK